MAGRMWNLFSNLWSWKKSTIPAEKRQNLTNIFNPYIFYIVKVQKILIWDEPLISAVSFVAVNILFWFLVNFEISFFFLVFGIAVLKHVYDVWTSYISQRVIRDPGDCRPAQSSEQNLSEIKEYLSVLCGNVNDIYVKLKMLHSEQRGLFCFYMCIIFSTFMMISRVVSGVVVTYVSIMMLFVAPGIYRLLPSSVVEKVRYVCSMFIIKDTDYVIDNYLPEENEENLAALSLTGDTADTDSDKEDSMFNLTEFSLGNENGGNSSENQISWSAGLSAFPSLEEESVDGLEPTDFDLNASALNKSTLRRLDVEFSDSDIDEETTGMNFQSSHFNGDSSEEEKHFVEGLEFSPSTHQKPSEERKPEAKETKPKEPTGIGDMIASSIVQNVSNLSSAVGQKMFSAFNIATQQLTSSGGDKSSDDSDDFEIIDDEDLS